jgi:hypothetical protein
MGAVDASEVREAVAHDEESPFDGVDLDKPLEPPPGFDPLTGEPQMPGQAGPPAPPMPGGSVPPVSPAPPGSPSNDDTGVELESVEALRSFASKKLGADGKPNRFTRGKG